MHAKVVVRFSKMVIPVFLLSLSVKSYSTAAYIPQTLRECIYAIYSSLDDKSKKQALEELYAIVTENRMLTSEKVVRKGVKKALEIIKTDANNFVRPNDIAEYLEEYLENLHDKAVVLSMRGNVSHEQWPSEVVKRSMQEDREVYDIVRLSNELSTNLTFCGASTNQFSLDSQVMRNITRSRHHSKSEDPSIIFPPSAMTNSQLSNPIIIGGTGVTSAVVNAWILQPSSQDPINMQFIIPDDFARHKPVSLELAILIPNNGLASGYANFQVQAKYLESSHSYNPDNINWTHTNTSGNVKITEATDMSNSKYVLIRIPLKRSHIKPGYFTILSISRIAPTDSKPEYAGDVNLVTAIFKYTSK